MSLMQMLSGTVRGLSFQWSNAQQVYNPVDYPYNVYTGRLIYSNGKYVLPISGSTLGSTTLISTSSDGLTWNTTSLSTTSYPVGVRSSNGKFVSVVVDYTNQNSSIYTSNDAISWQNTATFQNFVSRSLAVNSNGKFVLIDSSSNTSTSTDGITWSSPSTMSVSNLSSITTVYSSVFSSTNSNKFISVGNTPGGSYGTYTIAVSDDAITWTEVVSGLNFFISDISMDNPNRFVAVGATNGFFATPYYFSSSDGGLTWDVPSTFDGSGILMSGVSYANGTYMAVGYSRGFTTPYSAYFSTSNNGITWTTLNSFYNNLNNEDYPRITHDDIGNFVVAHRAFDANTGINSAVSSKYRLSSYT